MEKSKLINFINRYYLGGNTDTAKLVVENNTLSTKFISSDQNVIGDVTLKSFDSPDAELGVYTTSQLIKLMSALDENIDLVVFVSIHVLVVFVAAFALVVLLFLVVFVAVLVVVVAVVVLVLVS